ncbi:alpha-glycosidase [Paenibacillus thermoaerophilus]|uniref:Alpha-glycosidase n=1 Tax=Paenibacillus thermoaerophilus TaxID=1215385 RepID=A0ABW2V785_9BACL|nr:alpha-glycosidase [Paenibacillus thermoaerophilus]TMV17667.1 alpha-glycosidase [Paenibacillus thermoaerophilus]
MKVEAIYHRARFNWSYAYDEQTVHIRLRTLKGDVTEVDALTGDKYAWEQTRKLVPMRIFASDGLFDYWQTEVRPPYRRLRYGFRLASGDEELWMTEVGFESEEPPHPLDLFDFPYVHAADLLKPPAWVKDAIFYQIFPERFANGDPSNDPEGVLPWGGKPTPTNFFGGDLEGVLQKLDYLSELGVTAIYFNPIFQATTNHKYDTADYFTVDRHFGDNETLKRLVDACHARGIKVMLDAVFNHCGRTFAPFLDALEKGEASRYADWFVVREWPLTVKEGVPTYETFAFEPIMPKLNTSNPEVQDYLLRAAEYWIREVGIDGWRLDVANEVDHRFWRRFRDVVKAANPDAYILGEIWHDSLPWLLGDQFDAVMNYPFTNATLDFFARGKTDAVSFANAISRQIASYPQQVNEAAFNLLDSHDTPRLLTVCGGDKRRMRLALLFLLTNPGVPCLYYGDEVGMSGGYDPDCRQCMIWDEREQDRELFAFVRELIALRRRHRALRDGTFRFVHAEGGQLAYERTADGAKFLIAVNNESEPATITIDLSGSTASGWKTAFGTGVSAAVGERLSVRLPAFGCAVLRSE